MKMLKRSLAMMLALVMMFSAAPFTAFATESTDTPSTPTEAVVDAPASEPAPSEGTEETVPEETVVETTVDEETVPEETVVEEAPMMFSLAKSTQTVDASSFIKVFHLDCGRKYFTVDQIKELIDAISAKGFSHMELAIGNDGLRLLLDDMSITANGTTYNSDTIKSGIKSGNKNYSHSGEWTEAEMDTIIAYAKTKGIKGILVDAGYTDDVPSEPETEPTEPEVPETTKPSKPGKPNKPSKPTKPTEPEVEETKPSKPGNGNKPGNNKPGKPENTKPTEPQKPGKPGNNGNQKPGKEEKTYTLKITFVNLFGKKVGTATINTTKGMVSAYEIVGKAPAGRMAIWLIPVTLRANGNNSIVVPVI